MSKLHQNETIQKGLKELAIKKVEFDVDTIDRRLTATGNNTWALTRSLAAAGGPPTSLAAPANRTVTWCWQPEFEGFPPERRNASSPPHCCPGLPAWVPSGRLGPHCSEVCGPPSPAGQAVAAPTCPVDAVL